VPLVRAWGGVTLAYRKKMSDSPAYRLNHEEVIKALEEGITFAENMDPKEILSDERGHVQALRMTGPAGSVDMPARTVLVAAGTAPNVTYEKERPATFELDSKRRFFQGFRAEKADGGVTLVPDAGGFFTSHNDNGRLISYYGDNHPQYAGNVVKAMASAKHGYTKVAELFAEETAAIDPATQPARDAAWARLVSTLDADLLATVERVERLTPTIVEVVVKAPAAARHFSPASSTACRTSRPGVEGPGAGEPPLLMEGLALTGAWVDREKGLLSMIALEMGVSSRLIAYLKPGEPVVVMGRRVRPRRSRTAKTCCWPAAGSATPCCSRSPRRSRPTATGRVLRGLQEGRGPLQARGDRVVHRPGDLEHRYRRGDHARRPQDVHIRANIVQAMVAYANGELGHALVP
jgi:hypothetical protein